MRLLNDLFVIEANNFDREKNSHLIEILLHEKSVIYDAHFPDFPVLPGVVLIRIAQELISLIEGKELSIRSIKNVKFTTPINPLLSRHLSVELSSVNSDIETFNYTIVVKKNDVVFSKMNIEFIC